MRGTSALMLVVAVTVLARDQIVGAPYPLWAGLIPAVVIALGLVAMLSGFAPETPQLRVVELSVFAAMVGLIGQRDYAMLMEAADAGIALAAWKGIALHFVLLLGAYAMLVPNSLLRAAVMVAAIAAVPMVLVLVARSRNPLIELSISAGELLNMTTLLSAAVVVAAIGVGFLSLFRGLLIREKALGMYDLIREIGAGGMGEVWLAEHQRLARPAAVKLIRPDKLDSSAATAERLIQRFEREAKATAALRSPHTVEIYDYGRSGNGIFYYIMEYLEGLDLDDLVVRFGPVSAGRAIFLLKQACESLGEAHQRALIHRDVKPANIHCCHLGLEYDFVKVLDFGLVKPLEGEDEDVKLSLENVAQGTPAFMAPEIATGKGQVDGRADVYALGCVAYWLVTGTLVFEAKSPLQMAVSHATTEPEPPSQRHPDGEIPAALEAVILRSLAKNPQERYRSAAEFSEALAGCPQAAEWDAQRARQWWLEERPTE